MNIKKIEVISSSDGQCLEFHINSELIEKAYSGAEQMMLRKIAQSMSRKIGIQFEEFAHIEPEEDHAHSTGLAM